MSNKNPGVVFDATNSWNGYNHQGKIALWYSISQIVALHKSGMSIDEYRKVLEPYFLEIEYMEDFSIGRTSPTEVQYISVHQVKDWVSLSIYDYESALLGLATHFIDYPNISNAYLHITVEIELKSQSLLNHLKTILSSPQYLIDMETEINTKRSDYDFRNSLTQIRRGRPTKFKENLLNALIKVSPSSKKLDDSNLDMSFDQLLKDISEDKKELAGLGEEQLKKISLFQYEFNGIYQNYCETDKAENLLKEVIKQFFSLISPKGYKSGDAFVAKCYLWMLGKLDQYIIDRDLNYEAYKKGVLDRRIPFTMIFDWLISDEIDANDNSFYLYHIKEGIFNRIDGYCKSCSRRGTDCTKCEIKSCKNKLGLLTLGAFEKFIHITNPQVGGNLDMNSYSEYLGPGIYDPFAKGLRDIPQEFNKETEAISYKNIENLQCALTMLFCGGLDNDNAIISSEIIKNRNVYELLMDYDCLISKDIDITSIQDKEILQIPGYNSDMSEHIAHCKDVKIIPLCSFLRQLSNVKEKSEQ